MSGISISATVIYDKNGHFGGSADRVHLRPYKAVVQVTTSGRFYGAMNGALAWTERGAWRKAERMAKRLADEVRKKTAEPRIFEF